MSKTISKTDIFSILLPMLFLLFGTITENIYVLCFGGFSVVVSTLLLMFKGFIEIAEGFLELFKTILGSKR